MFNHFFYAPGGLETCEAFLEVSPSTTAIVVDPPFGGLAEVLARSLKQLWEMAGTGEIECEYKIVCNQRNDFMLASATLLIDDSIEPFWVLYNWSDDRFGNN